MVKKSRKLDLSPIEEDETTIDLESPRARFMDKSPSALAKELGLSTNTVKNRIEKTGLDFSIKNDGNYQMYNYECLPILKAYLDIPRISSATDGDTPAFFQRLENELASAPDQTFCKEYIYNKKSFQNFLLRSQTNHALNTRLACIRDLSQKLSLSKNQLCNPLYIQSLKHIISRADDLIFDLANFELPLTTGDQITSTPRKNIPQSSTALTKTWCQDLIKKRNKLTNNNQLRFSPRPQDIILALNQQLAGSTEETSEEYILLLSTLEYLQKQQEFISQANKIDDNSLQDKIYELIQYNLSAHLESLFQSKLAPTFNVPQELSINSIVDSAVFQYVQEAIYSTESLSRCFQALQLRFIVQKTYDFKNIGIIDSQYIHQLTDLQRTSEELVQTFWKTIRERFQISQDTSWFKLFSDVINSTPMSDTAFSTQSHRKELTEALILLVEKHDYSSLLDFSHTMIAIAVTMEYFFQKYAKATSHHIVCRCKEYQAVLEPYMNPNKAET